jgi:streptomycin 6-kinase
VTTLRLQPLTRARVARLGPAGARWAASLPQTLEAVADQWSLTLGSAVPGGSASYVSRARTREGVEVVVKIVLPDPGLSAQIAVLRRAAGRGYVRLLAADPARGVLLLERLHGSLGGSGRTAEDQLRILADTLLLAWQPTTAAPLDKATSLQRLILDSWERLGRPCSERVVDLAVSYAERRAADPGEPVVVHGDPHPGNLLAVREERPGAETGYCFVDPDGFVTDRAYDLGVALRDWCSRLRGPDARAVAEGYCEILAARTGVDATRIWEWGFIERVSTGLYVLDAIGSEKVGRPFLESAERLI